MTVKTSSFVNEPDFDVQSLEAVSSELEITSDEKPRKATLWRKFAGIVLTIIASFFFSIGSVIVKSISEISVSEMTMYRFGSESNVFINFKCASKLNVLIFAVLILITLILVTESKENWFGPSSWSYRFWILVRSVTGTTNIFLFYTALYYIPLANATVFMLSVPVFVFIFARIILKEPFGKWHVLAMIISTIGISLSSNIDFTSIFGGSKSNNQTETLTNSTQIEETSGISDSLTGVILCLICIITMSFVYISLRKVCLINSLFLNEIYKSKHFLLLDSQYQIQCSAFQFWHSWIY